jgi:ABC-type glycerol-3-phosphate transport system permease component
MRSTGAGRWLVAAPMALLAIATIYPMLYTLNIALKSRVDYVLDRGALTTTFNFQNFVDAWNQANMGRYYLNSILVTVVSVALILLIASMAGFALSHLTFRGSRATFLLILAAMMIPFQVIMVPFIKTLSDFGMINTYPGLIAAYVSQFLPFTVYFMTSYFARIPKEITEAARVDGNTIYGVFGRIMLPLGRPALLSMGILNALFCWNDILISLLVMQSPTVHRRAVASALAAPVGRTS